MLAAGSPILSPGSSADAAEVRDIIVAPLPVYPYDVLKDELIRRTCISESRRLQQMLTTEDLGDRTPSQLLHRVRQLLANATMDDALFRQLFLQFLPDSVRMMLSSADSATLDYLSKLADRILDASTVNPPAVNQVKTGADHF